MSRPFVSRQLERRRAMGPPKFASQIKQKTFVLRISRVYVPISFLRPSPPFRSHPAIHRRRPVCHPCLCSWQSNRNYKSQVELVNRRKRKHVASRSRDATVGHVAAIYPSAMIADIMQMRRCLLSRYATTYQSRVYISSQILSRNIRKIIKLSCLARRRSLIEQNRSILTINFDKIMVLIYYFFHVVFVLIIIFKKFLYTRDVITVILKDILKIRFRD